MSAIILHHYDDSPYANKIRKVLGYKGLPWQSVIIHDGFEAGDLVEVTPSGLGRCPVVGKLVVSNTHEVAVLRETDTLGKVAVHFPRAHVVITKVDSNR